MTWLGDDQAKPSDAERAKLLEKRAKIQKEIEVLGMKPIGPTNAARLGRIEDLTKLAKEIVKIDKKLGRM